jgi:phosphoribosylaminoimidazole synthetase
VADDQKLIKELSKYSDQIGGFAGKYSLPYPKVGSIGQKRELVASCDGVGTKILLAQIARDYYKRPLQSIGIDCVAMVVNDLLCKGAVPKFFLDYYASDNIREDEFYQVLAGIQEGCEEAEIELIGGETAELKGVISEGAFDVCGFGVGTIIDELPKDNIVVGDSVVGLESSGFHSNGFTIIRQYTSLDIEWISFLLVPTKIYVKHIELIREAGVKIKALAHITGGGFKNVDRILPDNLRVAYKQTIGYYAHHQLFEWIQMKTGMTLERMRSTFNCGIGMVIVLSPEEVEKLPVDSIHLGEIV